MNTNLQLGVLKLKSTNYRMTMRGETFVPWRWENNTVDSSPVITTMRLPVFGYIQRLHRRLSICIKYSDIMMPAA
jgi:hypothetical protein